MKKILIYIVLLNSLVACKSNKNMVTSSKFPPAVSTTKIEFGSGGGFSNMVRSYTLYNDGKLLEDGRLIKQLPIDSISAVFSMADSVKTNYRAPGNTYQFVNIYHQTDSVFCSWQFGDKKIKNEIILLYNKLRGLL